MMAHDFNMTANATHQNTNGVFWDTGDKALLNRDSTDELSMTAFTMPSVALKDFLSPIASSRTDSKEEATKRATIGWDSLSIFMHESLKDELSKVTRYVAKLEARLREMENQLSTVTRDARKIDGSNTELLLQMFPNLAKEYEKNGTIQNKSILKQGKPAFRSDKELEELL